MASNPGQSPRRVELPLLQVGRRNHRSCRWGCGDACSKEPPNRSGNETYAAVVERALSRRAFLAAGGVGALVLGAAAAPAEAPDEPPVGPYRPDPTGRRLAFTPIQPNNVDDVVLADGYADRVLIAWGDPVRPGAPDFDLDAQTPERQARQFGYNNDYLAFFPLPWWSANSFISRPTAGQGDAEQLRRWGHPVGHGADRRRELPLRQPGRGPDQQQGRRRGDLVGATKMDRPEDVQRNPVNGRVYVNLTNNTARTAPDPGNPRVPNPFGHVLEIREAGDDAGATSFTWRIFLLCGDPADPSTYFAGYPKELVSPIGSPDNMTFDNEGNIWLATDGSQPTGGNNALFACPTRGHERGHVQLFATVPVGAETCGPLLTRDNRSLFVAVQHPGEGGTVEEPTSHWPDGGDRLPRPAVTSIWRSAEGDPTIGQ